MAPNNSYRFDERYDFLTVWSRLVMLDSSIAKPDTQRKFKCVERRS
jgi:hypothetical protein